MGETWIEPRRTGRQLRPTKTHVATEDSMCCETAVGKGILTDAELCRLQKGYIHIENGR